MTGDLPKARYFEFVENIRPDGQFPLTRLYRRGRLFLGPYPRTCRIPTDGLGRLHFGQYTFHFPHGESDDGAEFREESASRCPGYSRTGTPDSSSAARRQYTYRRLHAANRPCTTRSGFLRIWSPQWWRGLLPGCGPQNRWKHQKTLSGSRPALV